MSFKTRRQINKEALYAKYKKMYEDVQAGKSFGDIARKYGYKNIHVARTTYFQSVLPYMLKNTV